MRSLASLLLATAVAVALAPPGRGQARASAVGTDGVRFDRASITANASGEVGRGRINFEPSGRFSATNVTVRQLIETAYRRHAFDQPEISGAPPWIDTDRFDVIAQAPAEHVFDGDGAPRQTWLMLQRLLADSFKLKVRYDHREQPVHALVVASGDGTLGPRLGRSPIDCASIMAKLIRAPGRGPAVRLRSLPAPARGAGGDNA